MAVNLIEYNATIYPRKLWVMYKPTLDEINESFIQGEQELKDSQYKILKENSAAITCCVFNKKGLYKGCLIIIFRKPTINTIAHESVHFADYIFEDLGIVKQNFSENNESYAYLVGWCAKCIDNFYKTIRSGKGKK